MLVVVNDKLIIVDYEKRTKVAISLSVIIFNYYQFYTVFRLINLIYLFINHIVICFLRLIGYWSNFVC